MTMGVWWDWKRKGPVLRWGTATAGAGAEAFGGHILQRDRARTGVVMMFWLGCFK